MDVTVVDQEIKGNAMCFPCEWSVSTIVHLFGGYSSCSLWIYQMAGELPSLLTTVAAVRAAWTPRRPRCRSSAAAAAVTRPASPPSVLRGPRTGALAQQRIYSTIVIKVSVRSSTEMAGLLQGLAHYTCFVLDHCIAFLLSGGGAVKDWLV